MDKRLQVEMLLQIWGKPWQNFRNSIVSLTDLGTALTNFQKLNHSEVDCEATLLLLIEPRCAICDEENGKNVSWLKRLEKWEPEISEIWLKVTHLGFFQCDESGEIYIYEFSPTGRLCWEIYLDNDEDWYFGFVTCLRTKWVLYGCKLSTIKTFRLYLAWCHTQLIIHNKKLPAEGRKRSFSVSAHFRHIPFKNFV